MKFYSLTSITSSVSCAYIKTVTPCIKRALVFQANNADEHKVVINSLSVSPHSVKLALKKPFDKTLYLYSKHFVLLKPSYCSNKDL